MSYENNATESGASLGNEQGAVINDNPGTENDLPEIIIEGYPPIDVKLRLFIPSRAIQVPPVPMLGDTGFAGDNRTFDYEAGTSRAEIWVDSFWDTDAEDAVSVKHIGFGQSEEYFAADLEMVGGRPAWWKSVRKVPFLDVEVAPFRIATAATDNSSLSVTALYGSEPLNPLPYLKISFHVNGINPLQAGAPAINGEIDLYITRSGNDVSCRVKGSHDAFPCWELYVDRQPIYTFDASFSDPFTLTSMHVEMIDIPWMALAR